jgi:hypothetical protein
MKYLILNFFAIFFVQSIKGQEINKFAPVNAKWYYNNQEMVMFAAHGYTLFEVTKDTIVLNKKATKITWKTLNYLGKQTNQGFEIVYEENKKFFF